MNLYYVDRRRLDHFWAGAGAGPAAAEVAAILDYRGISERMPVLLDESMRPVEPVCSWFLALSHERLDAKTMRAYAECVRRLCVFLGRRGTDLLGAEEADLVAFHGARTEGQSAPIRESTWEKDKAAIKKLYRWLTATGRVGREPYPPRGWGPMGGSYRREPKIRHMSLEQYTYFRDVGMAGLLPDGRVDSSFRGWAPHRNRAGLELALMTGMRLQEWSTVLMPELGIGRRRAGAGVEFRVQKCAKYEFERTVWVPSAAIDAVEAYVMLERPGLVERAQRTLRRKARDLFLVDRVDAEGWKLHGLYDGVRRVVAIEAMDPAMRGAAVIEGEAGLEPLAVFVGNGGGMLGPGRWDGVRKEAWARMVRHAGEAGAPALPARAFRFHDARHTFALQLLITLIDRLHARSAARARGERQVLSRDRATLFNAIITVQKALGHLQISSTYHYLNYLEDPAGAIDEAFRDWASNEHASYAEIGRRVLAGEVR